MKQKLKRNKVGILSIRLEKEQWDTLERWTNKQPVPPTIPEIVRVAVTEWIKRNAN